MKNKYIYTILALICALSSLHSQTLPIELARTQTHGDSYNFHQEYATFIDFSGEIGSGTQLSAGAQSFSVTFLLESEVGAGAVSEDTVNTRAYFSLGASPNFWAGTNENSPAGDDAFFGFGTSGDYAQKSTYFNQHTGGVAYEEGWETYVGQDLSSVAVTLNFTVGSGYTRTGSAVDVEYSFEALLDYGADGSRDNTISGTIVGNNYGVDLWIGSEYFYYDSDEVDEAISPEHRVLVNAIPEVSTYMPIPILTSVILFYLAPRKLRRT
jgi:hypothetical protein